MQSQNGLRVQSLQVNLYYEEELGFERLRVQHNTNHLIIRLDGRQQRNHIERK